MIFFLAQVAILVLQMRRVDRDNLEIIVNISPQNFYCDPSLELSCPDGSNEGSQYIYWSRNKKNYLELTLKSHLIWSSECEVMKVTVSIIKKLQSSR